MCFGKTASKNQRVPPVKAAPLDPTAVAARFIAAFAEQNGRAVEGISNEAMGLFEAYDWPGNIRELENVIERAVVLSPGPLLTADDLPPSLRGARPLAPLSLLTSRVSREQPFLLHPRSHPVTMAQGLAGSTAAATQEFLEEGAWNKRLHPGWAAVAGITAAHLARGGTVMTAIEAGEAAVARIAVGAA